jgi:hypothetical protein
MQAIEIKKFPAKQVDRVQAFVKSDAQSPAFSWTETLDRD